jgi:hypothetical protein
MPAGALDMLDETRLAAGSMVSPLRVPDGLPRAGQSVIVDA